MTGKKDTQVTPILDQNACDFSSTGNEYIDGLVQERLHTMGPTSVLFYRSPLEFEYGKGSWLYDKNGNGYLDAYNNVAVLGHGHPAVAEAVAGQFKKINTHSRYLNQASHHYARQLLATLPEGNTRLNDPRLLMTCTGSEANDVALRLAFIATGQQGVIVSEAAYHGNTYLVNQVSPSSCKHIPDWVVTFSLDALQSEDISSDKAQEIILTEISAAISLLKQRGYGIAALLADSIFSSDGVYALPQGFLTAAVDAVHNESGLFIADEVQPGFARTGDSFWGYMRHSYKDEIVRPDIVTFGKPMGNGYPVAGLIASDNLLKKFADDEGYFNTFAGSHAAVAAAQAVLTTVEQEQLQNNARQTGGILKQGLQQLAEESPLIRAVRGAGLFIGVDVVNQQGEPDSVLTGNIINLMRGERVLIGAAGRLGSTLKIRPPLCFSAQDADFFLEKFSRVLQSV